MNPSKRIVICPLNWGLGHASRCVPIIRELRSLGHEVLIAADGLPAQYLKNRFPELRHLDLPGYTVKYSSTNGFAYTLAKQIPFMLKSIKRENSLIKDIVEKYHPDLLISDNRYGVNHPELRSVLITHQLDPITPKPFREFSRLLIKSLLKPFTEIWVPDNDGHPLSGALSRGQKTERIRMIGPLSRFMHSQQKTEANESKQIDVLAIISGPEPRRSQLENRLINLLRDRPGQHVLICGIPGMRDPFKSGNLSVLPDADDASIRAYISLAEIVISGAGYSSLMDLRILGRGAYILPTKNQSEQEYLAALNHGKHGFIHLREEELDTISFERSADYSETAPSSELSQNLSRLLG